MELTEVKIGDMVTYQDKFKRNIKGRVIHRHDDASKAHLHGFVNVQKVNGTPAYPSTIHVSKIRPWIENDDKMPKAKKPTSSNAQDKKVLTKESYSNSFYTKNQGMIMSPISETYEDLLNMIQAQDNLNANKEFNALMDTKVDAALDAARETVAAQIFNDGVEIDSEEQIPDEENTETTEDAVVLTQDEFDALTDEEKAEFVPLDPEEFISSDDVITQDEFDTLSDEEKALYEPTIETEE